jgi:dTDP-4-amino-4,6-dideoxygalactose transaminase
MMKSRVPFLDLAAAHSELEEELVGIFRSALKSACFIGGPMVEGLEKDFAEFCGTKYCVGVSNGTDALRFALMAAGVGAGDSVVTVPNTFIATTEAITQAHALPEFVDIDERTYNMDPEKLREYLETQCTMDPSGKPVSRRSGRPVTAVVPVHLYGQTADMDSILELAAQYQLVVVEDACQAHGAEYFSAKLNRWRKAGSMGRLSAFSFYPGKNLGACGEAGAVTTNEEGLSAAVKMMRDHGQTKKYCHEVEGYNGRLDAIQAGILREKLTHLSKWNSQRRERAAEYKRLFSVTDGTVLLPHEPSWSRAVYHLYVVRVEDREGMMSQLKTAGIDTGIHYPIPLHLQKAYRHLNYKPGDFPVAEKIASQVVSLPMFPSLTSDQQTRVVEEVLRFAEGGVVSAGVGLLGSIPKALTM